jgi:hypothetical protein
LNGEAALKDWNTDTIFLIGTTTKIGHGEEIAFGSIAGKKYSSYSLTMLKLSPGMTGEKVIISVLWTKPKPSLS